MAGGAYREPTNIILKITSRKLAKVSFVLEFFSPEDIERFREEMMRGHQNQAATAGSTTQKKLISPPLSPTETSPPSSNTDSSKDVSASDDSNVESPQVAR